MLVNRHRRRNQFIVMNMNDEGVQKMNMNDDGFKK